MPAIDLIKSSINNSIRANIINLDLGGAMVDLQSSSICSNVGQMSQYHVTNCLINNVIDHRSAITQTKDKKLVVSARLQPNDYGYLIITAYLCSSRILQDCFCLYFSSHIFKSCLFWNNL